MDPAIAQAVRRRRGSSRDQKCCSENNYAADERGRINERKCCQSFAKISAIFEENARIVDGRPVVVGSFVRLDAGAAELA